MLAINHSLLKLYEKSWDYKFNKKYLRISLYFKIFEKLMKCLDKFIRTINSCFVTVT